MKFSNLVILSEAGTSRSEVSAESKDPYTLTGICGDCSAEARP
jgi:hypothetical protein